MITGMTVIKLRQNMDTHCIHQVSCLFMQMSNQPARCLEIWLAEEVEKKGRVMHLKFGIHFELSHYGHNRRIR